MYRNDARKSNNTARKSLKKARINSNSHAESKTFLGDFMLVDRCFKDNLGKITLKT